MPAATDALTKETGSSGRLHTEQNNAQNTFQLDYVTTSSGNKHAQLEAAEHQTTAVFTGVKVI